MQSCGRWLERSKKELVEAALGRLVFGQDEAGTARAKVRPNKSQKSQKNILFCVSPV
jgi:hypothetical protein